MAAQLVEFFSRYRGRPFLWGKDDCSLFIADWWREKHGDDPAAHLRGTYSTEVEKARIVRDAGGLLALVSGIAEAVGASQIEKPVTGCFAVIEPGVCAIYAQGFWVVRSETGLAFNKEAQALRMWSV